MSVGCQKKYITGGEVQNVNQYSNTSTYDVLTNFPQFDTLIQIIDAAGFKDKINQPNTTFFAPNNQAIYAYLQQRTLLLQSTVNQYAQFTLDSLKYYLSNNIDGTRDSLQMYLLSQTLTSSDLNAHGTQYPTQLSGDSIIVSYEETFDPNLGYSDLVSTPPKVMYFAQMWKHFDLQHDTAANIPSSIGVRTLVKTAFIKTENGMIDVLATGSPLFFWGTRPLDIYSSQESYVGYDSTTHSVAYNNTGSTSTKPMARINDSTFQLASVSDWGDGSGVMNLRLHADNTVTITGNVDASGVAPSSIINSGAPSTFDRATSTWTLHYKLIYTAGDIYYEETTETLKEQ